MKKSWIVGSVLALLGGVLCTGLLCYWLVTGPMIGMGEPATCKELVERLEGRGLKLHWFNRVGERGKPAIWILDASLPSLKDRSEAEIIREQAETHRYYLKDAPILYVTQFDTAQEAKEKAGSSPNAHAWGRFVINRPSESHDAFFQKVKKSL